MNREVFNQVRVLVMEFEGKESRNTPGHIVTQIFTLHNQIFDKKEYSKGCAGCRERCWNKLKTWYHEQKSNFQ